MSNFARKLRRIKERKNAMTESRLWTSDDFSYFHICRLKLLSAGTPKEAASRKAYRETRDHIACDVASNAGVSMGGD